MDTEKINTTALAYIGDSIYEVYIREHVMRQGAVHVDMLHKEAVKFTSAKGQALAIKKIFDTLSEEEQAFVKRARNHKSQSRSKNAGPVEYKWATALEALIGKLHLEENISREKEIIESAVSIIQGEYNG